MGRVPLPEELPREEKPMNPRRKACPECGREIRPSNMERHRRARHLPHGRIVE